MRTKDSRSTLAILLLTVGSLTLPVLTGQAAEYRWTGGGSGDYWSTIGNWEVDSGGWGPAAQAPGDGDVAILGDATGSDEAQNVVLDGNVSILTLKMEATGNRDYVISSFPDDTHTLTLTAAVWVPAFEQTVGTTCDLTLQAETMFSEANSYARLYSTSHARVVAERQISTSTTKGTFYLYGKASVPDEPAVGGILELRVPMDPNRLAVHSGAVVLLNYEGPDPVVASPVQLNTHGSIWVQRSARIAGGLWFSTRGYVRAYQAGDTNITLHIEGNVDRKGDHYFGPSLPESPATFSVTIGDMTGPVSANEQPPDITLSSNTVLVLGRDQTLPTNLAEQHGVHGAGALMKSDIAPLYQATSDIGMTNTYTGGTFVEDGTMILIEGDVPVTNNAPEMGHIFGQIGPGLLSVGTNGTFDLNGIDQTVSALQGGGKVLLGGATLSLTNGVAPGTNGVGTLTLEEAGALKMSDGLSVFEFSSDTNVFDRVVFTGTADLTLAGTLEITAPAGFNEYAAGRYTLFALAGGTLSGAFAKVIPPDLMTAEIDVTSGDVVLILAKRPTGTVITIQ